MSSVPDDLGGRPVLVLDPMLATGGSLEHTCRLLADRGAGPLTACACWPRPRASSASAPRGWSRTLVTASIDAHLNERAYIVPGLGDAGDRLFGTA